MKNKKYKSALDTLFSAFVRNMFRKFIQFDDLPLDKKCTKSKIWAKIHPLPIFFYQGKGHQTVYI